MLRILEGELAAPGACVALLLIELNDVPRFQAQLGFAGSGELLDSLHEICMEVLGARGHVVRMGEGRVCGVVRALRNRGHAMLAGEKLVRCADDLFGSAGMTVKPRVRIGIALQTPEQADANTLLRQAQLAAEASRRRAARVVVFDESCNAEVLATWALGNEFAQALDAGELSVHYQPKISLHTGRPAGAEALLRWLREGKPVAPPDVFIPLASDAGLMQATTWYALSNALRVSLDCGGLAVAVNVTPDMLHHREFPDMIYTAISSWKIEPSRLTLEITESALIADIATATARLSRFRDLGLRISIDDFGTGYSSLSYFKKIPADELKVDKSFVKGMTHDDDDHRLVRTIVDLAHHFKLAVVAEGVEDRATFDALARLGCDQVQGFLFSPALGADKLKTWLAAHDRDLREPAPTAG